MNKMLKLTALALALHPLLIYADTCPPPSSIQCVKQPSGASTCTVIVSGWSTSVSSYPTFPMGPIDFTMAELAVTPSWAYNVSCYYTAANGVALELDNNTTYKAVGSSWIPDPATNNHAGTYTCKSSFITNCQLTQ